MLAITILMDVSYALVEQVANTTLGTAVAPGTRAVAPASMANIAAGYELVVGNSTTNLETVTVISTTATTFTAAFVQSHLSTDYVWGANFPSGAPGYPIWTLMEMLGYLSDVQNDFLLKVRPLYTIGSLNITAGIGIYQAPSDCIRMERTSISGNQLSNTSAWNADLANQYWEGTSANTPRMWYQDVHSFTTSGYNPPAIGFVPPSSVGQTVSLWYAQKQPTDIPSPSTALVVPNVFYGAIKYGVLQRCFSKDGEQRDPTRAEFCQKMYDLIVILGIKFINGVQASMEEMQEPSMVPMNIG